MHFRITKLYKPFCIRFSFLNLMLLHLQIFYPSTSNLILLQNQLYPALAFGTTLTLVKSRQWDKSRKWDDCGWLANFVNYAVISENSSATLPPYDTSLIARNIGPPSFLSFPRVTVPSLHSALALSVKTKAAPLNQVLKILSTRLYNSLWASFSCCGIRVS